MPQSFIQVKTYAEVEAIYSLASGTYNNTYAGTEIYVSDKAWHLLCYYDREAKPKSGVLKINNGDTLPAWLTPEILQIDTGTLTGDLSEDTGTPLEITGISGYAPVYAYSTGTYASTVVLKDTDDNNYNASGFLPGESLPLLGYPDGKVYAKYYTDHILKFFGNLGTDNAQVVVEYRKKPI